MPAELRDWSLGRLLSTAARLVEHDWNHWLARHDLTHAGFLALHTLGPDALTAFTETKNVFISTEGSTP